MLEILDVVPKSPVPAPITVGSPTSVEGGDTTDVDGGISPVSPGVDDVPPLDELRMRNPSIFNLAPAFDDPSRTSTLSASTFSLICTILGGTSLSFPWAFARAGLLTSILIIILWAILTDFSLYLLLLCCRHNGCMTYEAVAQIAFGPKMRRTVTCLLFIICWLTITAYFILFGAVTTSVWKGISSNSDGSSTVESENLVRCISMTVMACFALPRCCVSRLNNLRHTNVVSVPAFFVLLLVLAIRAMRTMKTESIQVVWFPLEWQNIPYTLSLYSAAFVCHFNILPIHMELQRPTRSRMTKVIHGTISFCASMFVSVGTLGYLFAGSESCDNILSNFCHTDNLANLARSALSLIIFMNFPFTAIPARNCLDRLVTFGPEVTSYSAVEDCQTVLDPPLTRRIVFAAPVVGTSLAIACLVPGVSNVWTVVGSSVCILVGFILPATFFLKVGPQHQQTNWKSRSFYAILLLGFSIIVSLLSTYQAFRHVGAPTCPAGFDPCAN